MSDQVRRFGRLHNTSNNGTNGSDNGASSNQPNAKEESVDKVSFDTVENNINGVSDNFCGQKRVKTFRVFGPAKKSAPAADNHWSYANSLNSSSASCTVSNEPSSVERTPVEPPSGNRSETLAVSPIAFSKSKISNEPNIRNSDPEKPSSQLRNSYTMGNNLISTSSSAIRASPSTSTTLSTMNPLPSTFERPYSLLVPNSSEHVHSMLQSSGTLSPMASSLRNMKLEDKDTRDTLPKPPNRESLDHQLLESRRDVSSSFLNSNVASDRSSSFNLSDRESFGCAPFVTSLRGSKKTSSLNVFPSSPFECESVPMKRPAEERRSLGSSFSLATHSEEGPMMSSPFDLFSGGRNAFSWDSFDSRRSSTDSRHSGDFQGIGYLRDGCDSPRKSLSPSRMSLESDDGLCRRSRKTRDLHRLNSVPVADTNKNNRDRSDSKGKVGSGQDLVFSVSIARPASPTITLSDLPLTAPSSPIASNTRDPALSSIYSPCPSAKINHFETPKELCCWEGSQPSCSRIIGVLKSRIKEIKAKLGGTNGTNALHRTISCPAASLLSMNNHDFQNSPTSFVSFTAEELRHYECSKSQEKYGDKDLRQPVSPEAPMEASNWNNTNPSHFKCEKAADIYSSRVSWLDNAMDLTSSRPNHPIENSVSFANVLSPSSKGAARRNARRRWTSQQKWRRMSIGNHLRLSPFKKESSSVFSSSMMDKDGYDDDIELEDENTLSSQQDMEDGSSLKRLDGLAAMEVEDYDSDTSQESLSAELPLTQNEADEGTVKKSHVETARVSYYQSESPFALSNFLQLVASSDLSNSRPKKKKVKSKAGGAKRLRHEMNQWKSRLIGGQLVDSLVSPAMACDPYHILPNTRDANRVIFLHFAGCHPSFDTQTSMDEMTDPWEMARHNKMRKRDDVISEQQYDQSWIFVGVECPQHHSLQIYVLPSTVVLLELPLQPGSLIGSPSWSSFSQFASQWKESSSLSSSKSPLLNSGSSFLFYLSQSIDHYVHQYSTHFSCFQSYLTPIAEALSSLTNPDLMELSKAPLMEFQWHSSFQSSLLPSLLSSYASSLATITSLASLFSSPSCSVSSRLSCPLVSKVLSFVPISIVTTTTSTSQNTLSKKQEKDGSSSHGVTPLLNKSLLLHQWKEDALRLANWENLPVHQSRKFMERIRCRYENRSFLSEGACKKVYRWKCPISMATITSGKNANNEESSRSNQLSKANKNHRSKMIEASCPSSSRGEELQFAVSVMDIAELQERSMDEAIYQEVSLALRCSSLTSLHICPNFLRIYSVFRLPEDIGSSENDNNSAWNAKKKGKNSSSPGYHYIRMELCHGGDLEGHVRQDGWEHQAWSLLPEATASEGLCWMFQMAFSLYCGREQLKLRHYDIKLLNFLVTSGDSLYRENAMRMEHGNVEESSLSSNSKFWMQISLRHQHYRILMDRQKICLLKMADFGTSCLGSDTWGQSITAQQFTTLENSPPEFLFFGSQSKDQYEGDTFALGLCYLHLLMGREPYEVWLDEVRCPVALKNRLRTCWESTKYKQYAVIKEVMDSLEPIEDESEADGVAGDILYDTLYRYCVLFSEDWFFLQQACIEDQKLLSASPVWKILVELLFQDRLISEQYERDCFLWSIGKGINLSRVQALFRQNPALDSLLRKMTVINPSHRCTMLEILESPLFACLLHHECQSMSTDDYPVVKYSFYETSDGSPYLLDV